MKSALYQCEVYHERLAPKRHHFRYDLFFLDLDLSEIPALARSLLFFSHNRFNLYSFRDRDHFDRSPQSIRDKLDSWLAHQGVQLPENATVRLITLPRILGYLFNPVCFYFISDPSGKPLYAVAEVCNTFREVKPWLLTDQEENGSFRRIVPKEFYVSPFSKLTAKFDFRFKIPDDRLEIHIDSIENDEKMLVSWIRGERRPLTNGRLVWETSSGSLK